MKLNDFIQIWCNFATNFQKAKKWRQSSQFLTKKPKGGMGSPIASKDDLFSVIFKTQKKEMTKTEKIIL